MGYFAITTVTTDVPTGASGTVTFTVADPSMLPAVPFSAWHYPQRRNDTSGVTRAKQAQKIDVTAVNGNTVTATLGADTTGKAISFGDIIDATAFAMPGLVRIHHPDNGVHINPGTATTPVQLSIIEGTAAAPATNHASATVMITRRSAMTVVDDSNAALWVNHVNDGATQPVALKGYAANIGAGDACAVYGQVTTITGRAYGGFFLASVSSNALGTPGAVGLNPFIGNLTGVDATWDGAGGTPFLAGVFIQAVGSGKKTGAAIMVSDSNNHGVGIGFKPGSVSDYTFLDSSSSVRSLYVTGAHSYGLDLSTGTYSVASIAVDPTFTLGIVSSNEPFIGFDTSDFLAYFRNVNQLQLLIGGTNTLFVGTGLLGYVGLPSANPGAASKQFWYDPADGNRVKYGA